MSKYGKVQYKHGWFAVPDHIIGSNLLSGRLEFLSHAALKMYLYLAARTNGSVMEISTADVMKFAGLNKNNTEPARRELMKKPALIRAEKIGNGARYKYQVLSKSSDTVVDDTWGVLPEVAKPKPITIIAPVPKEQPEVVVIETPAQTVTKPTARPGDLMPKNHSRNRD